MNKIIALVLSAGVFLAPAQAWAHAHLTRSIPAAGSSVSESPPVIRLWFSESPEASMTFAQLTDSAGKSFRLGTAERRKANELEIDFAVMQSLAPGKYTLSWRASATDGHPTRGKFEFDIQARAAVKSVSPPISMSDANARPAEAPRLTVANTADANEDPAGSVPNSLARALLFLGLLLLIGTVTFALFVIARAGNVTETAKEVMKRRAAMLGMAAATLVIVAALLRLSLESQMMNAMPAMPGMIGFSTQQMVMRTWWGIAFLMQVLVALFSLIALGAAYRGFKPGWYIAAVSSFFLAITPALSGHAAASPRFTTLMVVSDWLHVLGAASWLGTLACVMTIAVPLALKQDGDERWRWVSSLVNEFSRLAVVSVAVVVISGVFASWMHIAGLSDLWTTRYGVLLLIKLSLVAITLAIGAYNFKRVQPRLSVEQGTARLRNSAALELATGFVILVVTGFLTGVSP